jgi:hypothetical protein
MTSGERSGFARTEAVMFSETVKVRVMARKMKFAEARQDPEVLSEAEIRLLRGD